MSARVKSLILEDDPAFETLYHHFIGDIWDFDVHLEGDEAALLSKSSSSEFDLFFVRVGKNYLQSYETCRSIKSQTAHSVVFAVSAAIDDRLRLECLKQGFDGTFEMDFSERRMNLLKQEIESCIACRMDNMRYHFCLYYTERPRGPREVPKDWASIADNLRSFMEIYGLNGVYRLQTVDVNRYPEEAERSRILAIPSLVRIFPEPRKEWVGDLKDHAAFKKMIIGRDIADGKSGDGKLEKYDFPYSHES